MLKVSWQAKRLKLAKALANQMTLKDLIEYSAFIRKNLGLKPEYAKDILMVKKAIEIKVSGV